jgi:hypothetical protein
VKKLFGSIVLRKPGYAWVIVNVAIVSICTTIIPTTIIAIFTATSL